jgi:hypothetical protein
MDQKTTPAFALSPSLRASLERAVAPRPTPAPAASAWRVDFMHTTRVARHVGLYRPERDRNGRLLYTALIRVEGTRVREQAWDLHQPHVDVVTEHPTSEAAATFAAERVLAFLGGAS